MNGPRICAFALALLLASGATAAPPDVIFRARALLGPDFPARVVRIENTATGPSRYPAEFYGLVIPFADILWLYTEFDGTQNLSSRRGRVDDDNRNLGALLRHVEPGLVGFSEVTPQPVSPAGSAGLPPNSCFLACLVRWEKLQAERHPPRRARLIACYPPNEKRGHMVLEFWRGDRRYVFDPDRPEKLIRLPRRVGQEALAVAAAVLAPRWAVTPAKATPVELSPVRPATLVAGEASPPQPRS